MPKRERTVLHVLPHTGGGGETYVDLLSEMPGYRVDRAHITEGRKARASEVARGFAKVVRLLRAYDLVHVHGEGTAALFLPVLATRPSVVTLHGLHLLRRVGGWQRSAAALNIRAIVRAASRTICVSETERDLLVAVAPSKRVVVVHNGARIPSAVVDGAAVRAELGLEGDQPIAIWVGALDERRDPFVAIRAALRTNTPLLFVGGGPLRAEAERVARAPVRFLGQRDDVPRLLAAADFFVLISEREGLSFGLLEAMAHGLPAVVSDIAENLEAIGETGIAVPYRDEEALVAAFRRLAEDPPERHALGQAARNRVAERFDVSDMVERTRAVYDEVLRSRSV